MHTAFCSASIAPVSGAIALDAIEGDDCKGKVVRALYRWRSNKIRISRNIKDRA